VTLFLIVALVVVCALRALAGWRVGIVLMIALAAVQDPLRKLVPGTPGWLVLMTAPVFAAAILGSLCSHGGWWRDFRRQHGTIARSMLLLCVLSLPAAVLSATYSPGSWILTLLGIFSYSVIFLAMIAGFHYARGERDLRGLLVAYCLLHGVMLSGALLEYLHFFSGSPLLGSRALGYEWIRWGRGYTVDMIAGFYRSADVMGWHAAAVAMISVILALTAKSSRRWGWFTLSMFAAIALLLCGRRKMVYMLPVFLVAFGFIFWQAGRAARVVALAGFLALPLASIVIVGDWIGEGSANIRYYRGDDLQQDAMQSIRGQGFSSVVQTYRQTGVLGAGLGFATPGSHHIGVSRPRVWQESTSSRIMVELGVPGAIGFLLVMLGIATKLWRVAISQLRANTSSSVYVGGLVAFFMANVGSLVVSGQILADPFIATFLGFLVGVTLSVPRLGQRFGLLRSAPSRERPAWRPLAVADNAIVEDLKGLPW
jgi:hypothetical protein